MSAEQDKESLPLKRNRGGDGGLESLGGSGLLLGSPDKKRRKSNVQVSPFPPLSEYAPPANPSSDHLVACNPFDDSYNSPPISLKPLSNTNSYFTPSHFPGFSYGTTRTSPHIQNRMPSPYGSSYHIRNHPHPFAQNPAGMGLPRSHGFNHAQSESHMFNGLSGDASMRLSPAQPFRENVNQLSLINHRADPGSIRHTVMKRSPDHINLSPGLVQSPASFTKPISLKQEVSETIIKSDTPSKKTFQSSEDLSIQEAELKAKNKSKEIEKVNGVIHPNTEPLKKSPRPNENSSERNRRPGNNKSGNRTRPNSSTPTEPVYPCGICQVEVKDDQDAILCEASCQKWFHRLCTGMTETAYNLLTAESAAVWGCDTCMKEKDGAHLLKPRETTGPTTASSERQT